MRPLRTDEIKQLFGAFAWREGKAGAIIIDPNWVDLYIVRENMPIVGTVACHKYIVLELMQIFTEIEQAGLARHVNVQEFRDNIAGCWVARHKCWDMTRTLSRHSWGIAIDLNVRKNPYNSPSMQHPAIVEIFEDRGFYHGGRFLVSDPMHLEIGAHWSPLKQVIMRQRLYH